MNKTKHIEIIDLCSSDEDSFIEYCRWKHSKCTAPRSKYTEYCNKHNGFMFGVEARDSDVSGIGLFAIRNFKKDTTILYYKGMRTTTKPVNSEYVVKVCNGYYIDAKDPKSGLARLINHADTSSGLTNCRLSVNYKNKTLPIKADKNIQRGEELLMDYGPLYWDDYIS